MLEYYDFWNNRNLKGIWQSLEIKMYKALNLLLLQSHVYEM